MFMPLSSDAIASRILCANTKLVLYCTPKSRERASMLLPFTSFAEDGDGEKVRTQRQLVKCEQCSARDRKILPASFAAPAWRAVRASARINDRATAERAVGIAVIVCPAKPDEH